MTLKTSDTMSDWRLRYIFGKIRKIAPAMRVSEVEYKHSLAYHACGRTDGSIKDLSGAEFVEIKRKLEADERAASISTNPQPPKSEAKQKRFNNYYDSQCQGRLKYICSLMYSDPAKTFLNPALKIDWNKVNDFFANSKKLPKNLPNKRFNEYTYEELGLIVNMMEGIQKHNFKLK